MIKKGTGVLLSLLVAVHALAGTGQVWTVGNALWPSGSAWLASATRTSVEALRPVGWARC